MGLSNANLFSFNKETRRAFTHVCWVISFGGRAARLAHGPELFLGAKRKTNAGDSRKKNTHGCVPFVPPRSDTRLRRLAPRRRGLPAGPIPRGSAVLGGRGCRPERRWLALPCHLASPARIAGPRPPQRRVLVAGLRERCGLLISLELQELQLFFFFLH